MMETPDQYRSAKLSDFGEDIKSKVKRGMEAGSMITVLGSTGSGKTRLAMAVYRQLKYRRTAEFICVPEFVSELQSTMSKWGSHEVENMVKRARAFDGVMVLDDFGSEKMTEFVRQSLFIIINHREMYNRCTIITSNRSLGEISEMIEERIASRLASGLVINLELQDHRLPKGIEHGS